jgi:hypothetical protein
MRPRAERLSIEALAGPAAILAGTCWLIWIAVNYFSGDLSPTEAPRLTKLVQVLMAGWNLFLIPAALVLYRRLRWQGSDPAMVLTSCGIISLLFWAYGGASNTITPGAEVVYLILSGIWWLGVGYLLMTSHRYFAVFTMVLGSFTLLDALLSFLEPMPFYVYALAAPKLPLSIIWDFYLGFWLIREYRFQLRSIPRSPTSPDFSADPRRILA